MSLDSYDLTLYAGWFVEYPLEFRYVQSWSVSPGTSSSIEEVKNTGIAFVSEKELLITVIAEALVKVAL